MKISSTTHLREILYTDCQDMLVLSCTVTSRYYYWEIIVLACIVYSVARLSMTQVSMLEEQSSCLLSACKGPRPLVQCRFRPVQFCASTSVGAAASRTVELQTWYRKHTPHPSYYSLLLPLYVFHRPHSTQE
jgi:hypothetical protein